MCSEIGIAAPAATTELHPTTLLGSYQAAATSPFGPADRQRLLEAAGPHQRLDLLRTMLLEERGFLEARLALEADGDEPPGGDGGAGAG
jgi:hypothetical protein